MDMRVDSLRAAQVALEEDAVGLGVERYREEAKRDHASTTVGQRLLAEAFKRISVELEDAIKGIANKQADIRDFLMDFDVDTLALATAHAMVNEMAISDEAGRAVQTVAIELADTLASTLDYTELKKVDPKAHKRLLRRTARASNPRARRAMLEKAREAAKVRSEVRTEKELARVGLWLLLYACKVTGFAEVIDRPHSTSVLRTTEETQDTLAAEHAKLEKLHPRRFPMLCTPIDWTTPVGGGFLTKALRVAAVKRLGDEELTDVHRRFVDEMFVKKGETAWKTGDVTTKATSMAYTALNGMQRTPWAVNADVYSVLSEVWLACREIAGLPTKDARRDERRCVEGDLDMANRMLLAERFYFVYTMDFRGRLYAASDYMNPQGKDTARALLRFADGVALGEHGAAWLAIHGANCFAVGGIDKESFEQRTAWVKRNEQEIITSAKHPLAEKPWWAGAEKPWQFLAFCKEWARLHEWRASGGRDADFVSYLPVSVDGTCNGLQHLSMLMRDPDGAAATNLSPSEKPADAYRQVADAAMAAHPELAEYLQGPLGRKLAKHPTMTLVYGAGLYRNRQQIRDALGDGDEALPGELWEVAGELAPAVRAAVKSVARRAVDAMDWLRAVAEMFAEDGGHLRWTTPAGLRVTQRYMKKFGDTVEVTIDGVRRRLLLKVNGEELDKSRMVTSIVANFVHSLDAAHLMRTIEYALQQDVGAFAAVHDSYGTHAGSMQILAHELRRAFVDQYRKGNLLKEWIEAILFDVGEDALGGLPEVPEMGDLDPCIVMHSKYFFA